MDSNKLLKFYDNFAGIDLRSADISQNPQSATAMSNADYRDSGSITKRKGFQLVAANSKGGYGATTFENVNTSGEVTEEFITIDQNLFKLSEDSFTITYTSGDGSVGKYEMYYDVSNANFYFDLYNNAGTRVLNHTIGNGYSGSNQTVTQLTTAIDALAAFAATAAATAGGENAAFIPVTAGKVDLADGVATTVTFKYYTQIDTPSTYSNPFSTFYAERADSNFENASFAQLNDVLYISTGHNALHKYDGLRVYKAGLPVPTTPTAVENGAGSLGASAYRWKYTYLYKDAKGNEIESTPSEYVSVTPSAGSKNVDVTVTNLQETSGYNVDQAKANGNQNGVTTITVDAAHGLTTGDYVYLQDGVSNSVVSRKVTATTTTTITIDGANVNVLDNAVISCIKIALYRTLTGGTTLFNLSKELLNDIDNNTQLYADGTADGSLGAEFIEPIKPHGLPVSGKYIRPWRNQLVIAGVLDTANTVYYSDIENPEYFPPADNSFNVENLVTGIRESDNFLYVFKHKSISVVSGDFGTDQFEVDLLSRQVGCEAFHSILDINGDIWFLSKNGVYHISNGKVTEISEPIRPRFLRPASEMSFKQSVAFNWADKHKYLLYLPNLTTDPTFSSDTNSKMYVFDYSRRHNAWHEWSNINILGGVSKLDDDLYFVRRAKPVSTIYLHTQKMLTTYTKADYIDHDTAISFSYKTHWETAGEPAIFKKFLRVKVYSLDATLEHFEMDSFTLTVNVYGNFLNSELGSFDMDFSGGAEGWGSAWGATPWGELLLPDLKNKLVSKKLRSQQLEFTNSTAKENILISGYELEMVAPFKPAIKE